MKKIDAILILTSAMTEKIGYSLEGTSYIESYHNKEIEAVMELYFTGNSCYLTNLQFFINTITYDLDAEGINGDLKKVFKRFAKRLGKYNSEIAQDIIEKITELSE